MDEPARSLLRRRERSRRENRDVEHGARESERARAQRVVEPNAEGWRQGHGRRLSGQGRADPRERTIGPVGRWQVAVRGHRGRLRSGRGPAPVVEEGDVSKLVLVVAAILTIVIPVVAQRGGGDGKGVLGPVNALGQEVQRPPAPTGPPPRLPDGTIDLGDGIWVGGGPVNSIAQGLKKGETL